MWNVRSPESAGSGLGRNARSESESAMINSEALTVVDRLLVSGDFAVELVVAALDQNKLVSPRKQEIVPSVTDVVDVGDAESEAGWDAKKKVRDCANREHY